MVQSYTRNLYRKGKGIVLVRHGCLKRLFIDFLTKNVIFYFTKRWKPVQIIVVGIYLGSTTVKATWAVSCEKMHVQDNCNDDYYDDDVIDVIKRVPFPPARFLGQWNRVVDGVPGCVFRRWSWSRQERDDPTSHRHELCCIKKGAPKKNGSIATNRSRQTNQRHAGPWCDWALVKSVVIS